MASNFARKVLSLDLEEKILNGGVLITLVGIFLPWISGESLGGLVHSYTGLGFYTSFIGLLVFSINLFLLLITLIPLTGGPVLVRKRHREIVRLCLTALSVILTIAALSVLIKVTTSDLRRMEIRFGVYTCLIGSLVALLYAFLRFQEQRKADVQEIFYHPEEKEKLVDKQEYFDAPPPPAPPKQSPPEEHRLYR